MTHSWETLMQLFYDGKYQQFIQMVRERIANNPFPVYKDYHRLSIAYEMIGDTQNQEKVYQEIDKLDLANDHYYYNGYASLLITQQRFSEALIILQKGIRQYSTAEELFYTEAFIWYMMEEDIEGKNVNNAYNAINKAIRLYTQQNEFAYDSYYFLRAKICYQLGKYEEAVKDLWLLINDLYRSDPWIQAALGDVQLAKGNYKVAYTYYQNAIMQGYDFCEDDYKTAFRWYSLEHLAFFEEECIEYREDMMRRGNQLLNEEFELTEAERARITAKMQVLRAEKKQENDFWAVHYDEVRAVYDYVFDRMKLGLSDHDIYVAVCGVIRKFEQYLPHYDYLYHKYVQLWEAEGSEQDKIDLRNFEYSFREELITMMRLYYWGHEANIRRKNS